MNKRKKILKAFRLANRFQLPRKDADLVEIERLVEQVGGRTSNIPSTVYEMKMRFGARYPASSVARTISKRLRSLSACISDLSEKFRFTEAAQGVNGIAMDLCGLMSDYNEVCHIGNALTIRVNDITVKGKDREVFIGDLIVRVPFDIFVTRNIDSIKAFGIDSTIRCKEGFIHPHVWSSGKICLGGAVPVINSSILQHDLSGIVEAVVAVLGTCNEGDVVWCFDYWFLPTCVLCGETTDSKCGECEAACCCLFRCNSCDGTYCGECEAAVGSSQGLGVCGRCFGCCEDCGSEVLSDDMSYGLCSDCRTECGVCECEYPIWELVDGVCSECLTERENNEQVEEEEGEEGDEGNDGERAGVTGDGGATSSGQEIHSSGSQPTPFV